MDDNFSIEAHGDLGCSGSPFLRNLHILVKIDFSFYLGFVKKMRNL